MKLYIDQTEIKDISDNELLLLKYITNEDEFVADLANIIESALNSRAELCFNAMKREWDTKLIGAGITSAPLERSAYISLVTSQPDYKDKKARDEEELVSDGD